MPLDVFVILAALQGREHLASKIDKRKKPYNIKNKALPHCRKCGKFQQADRPYETY